MGNRYEILKELFYTNYEHLYRFAYEIVQEEEAAQDIVSDTFTVLLEKEHNVSPDRMKGYLFITLKNNCISWLRKKKKESEMSDYLQFLSETDDTDALLYQEERIEELNKVLNTLPERTRYVLEQCYYHNHTYREVGELMGISNSGVKKHIVKAFGILREHFKIYKK